jgi:hypothetical protein
VAQQLILKRASASRPSGEWSEDGYDVLADGAVVGRIMKSAASLVAGFAFAAHARRAATQPPRRRVQPAIPAVQ